MGSFEDTIYALATAPGQAGIAIVRVSGQDALASLKSMSNKNFPPREAVLASLINPNDCSLIDKAVVIYFQPPASYTGEVVVEYHIHGGRAVKDSLFAYFETCENHRLAEPGEFTRRAFENGQMDLTQAEAVADLIHAETEYQKQNALEQMEGSLYQLYSGWTKKLLKALAYAEAQIDFSEEDLSEDEVNQAIHPILKQIKDEIEAHLDDNRRGEIIRDGVKIAIIGAPNVGKSSLLNAIAKRDVAITSDIAGTTRDVLSVDLNLNGYAVTLYDTAGLRPEQLNQDNPNDIVEAEGIRRALDIANKADLKILVFDKDNYKSDKNTLQLKDDKSILVVNKNDNYQEINNNYLFISVQNSWNIDKLIDIVSRETINLLNNHTHQPSLTRARYREALVKAQNAIEKALNGYSSDMKVEDIRMAVRYLGQITGRSNVEDLLDIIFKDFCIGK